MLGANGISKQQLDPRLRNRQFELSLDALITYFGECWRSWDVGLPAGPSADEDFIEVSVERKGLFIGPLQSSLIPGPGCILAAVNCRAQGICAVKANGQKTDTWEEKSSAKVIEEQEGEPVESDSCSAHCPGLQEARSLSALTLVLSLQTPPVTTVTPRAAAEWDRHRRCSNVCLDTPIYNTPTSTHPLLLAEASEDALSLGMALLTPPTPGLPLKVMVILFQQD
ncbi:hypothetical protein NQZ68_003837 [Dissostichus eleginoides]|nr:hypothetical protein NQZ68_003837 [Dissostichus eleginoides]